MWKPDGTWTMTVDYQELNKAVPPVYAPLTNITSLLKRAGEALDTYHYHFVTDLTNAFFSIPTAPRVKTNLHSPGKNNRPLPSCPRDIYIAMEVLEGVHVFHYTNDIVLTSESLSSFQFAPPHLAVSSGKQSMSDKHRQKSRVQAYQPNT